MNIQQLKIEAAGLPDAERRELIGYLITKGRERSDEYWARMAAKIEDQNPGNWVREEALDGVLGLDESKP